MMLRLSGSLLMALLALSPPHAARCTDPAAAENPTHLLELKTEWTDGGSARGSFTGFVDGELRKDMSGTFVLSVKP